MAPGLLAAGYLAVVLLPLALAALGARPPRGVWDELATGAGMLAFSVILVEFVLSGRFRPISRRIGMDVTMRLHQLFARTALGLALVHPFLYESPFRHPLPWDDTRALTLTADLASLGTGVAAWVLLPAFVLLSIARNALRYRYEAWRLLHGLGALLIAGLVLHHTLSAGRYSADPVLAWTWIGLAGVAALTLLHVYLLRPLLQLRRPWRVASVRPAALRTWEVRIEPEGHRGLRFDAGQFVWLNIGHSPFTLAENPFSISSAPAAGPALEFIVKELGDFTSTVGSIAPGTRAHVDGPHGSLSVAGRSEPGIALIAGGVGIAPLLGILRQLRLERDPRPTVLVYGNRIADQIVGGEELDEIARTHGTRVVHVLSEPPEGWTGGIGMIGPALLAEVFADPATRGWLYVLCGPAPMMEVAEETLTAMGVPASRILAERFDYD